MDSQVPVPDFKAKERTVKIDFGAGLSRFSTFFPTFNPDLMA